MRSFAFLVEKIGAFREPAVPDERLSRANPSGTQLIDEAIKSAFDLACMNDDLDAAADLLALIQKRHTVRAHADAEARRVGGYYVRRMRGELDRRHIMRGTRPPADLWTDEAVV